MITLLLLVSGLALGLGLRERLPLSFAALFRSHSVMLVAPMSLLAGWTFQPKASGLLIMVVILAAETLSVVAALRWLRRRSDNAMLPLSGMSNSGFWAVPVAGYLGGPSSAAFCAVFDQITSLLRGSLSIGVMRAYAPTPQPRVTALIDYAPQAALVIGFLLNLGLATPEWTGSALQATALINGLLGFFMLGQAVPGWPARTDWLAVRLSALLRFAPITLALVLVSLLGWDVPAGAWVLALAPTAFAHLSRARLYGYPVLRNVAITLQNLALALLLLPLTAWLCSL